LNSLAPLDVCFFHNPALSGTVAGRFHISTLDPAPYLAAASRGARHLGRKLASLRSAADLDHLYRTRDPGYMRFIDDFVARYRDADVLILATYNPIHPEVLHHVLHRPIKVLGFIDDPYSTYVRGIPYLWAFDGAFYISPGYNADHTFPQALKAWGCPSSHWYPLVMQDYPGLPSAEEEAHFYAERDVDVVYVGASYGPKLDRLITLKKHFGPRLRVHGRWALRGHVGWLRGLIGKPVFPHVVTGLGEAERSALYRRARIGINMHLSNIPAETGNMRMYEVPAHGAMLVCDTAARDAHALIFEPQREAIYYRSVEEAIELIEHYLRHPAERIGIAKAGCERAYRDYGRERVLLDLLNWAAGLRRGVSQDAGLGAQGAGRAVSA
jgi:hypothetical protein